MKVIINSLRRIKQFHNIRYYFTSPNRNSYEGPGKSTVQFLNQTTTSSFLIRSCSQTGFILHNGLKVIGPMVIFPKIILYWDVATTADINRSSLMLFFTLDPKPDLVVIGVEGSCDFKLLNDIKAIFKGEDIPVEILPVRKACQVFNFVCEEGRFVGGAFIPPKESSIPALLKAIQTGQQTLTSMADKKTNNK